MAFEALNNAGATDADLLVILNDNEMSISPPVGALNKYFAKLMSGRFYAAARGLGEKVLGELAKRAEEHVKGMVTPGTLFEEMGFNYIGPIDGHDLDALIPTLRNMKELKGPQFLHVVTRKGQGYKLAEADPVLYHGVSKFDAVNGIVGGKSGGKLTYTQVFGDWLCDMAAQGPAPRRHHAGDARGLRAGEVRGALSRPLLRCRHCRAAFSDLRGGARLRGLQAGGGDLLDLPAARLRPADPRRADPESPDPVRDRSRRAGGRRRRDP